MIEWIGYDQVPLWAKVPRKWECFSPQRLPWSLDPCWIGPRHGDGIGLENTNPMNNLVNIIIVLLIVGWLIGYIGFGAMVGNLIHILLILAVVAIVIRLVSGGKAKL